MSHFFFCYHSVESTNSLLKIMILLFYPTNWVWSWIEALVLIRLILAAKNLPRLERIIHVTVVMEVRTRISSITISKSRENIPLKAKVSMLRSKCCTCTHTTPAWVRLEFLSERKRMASMLIFKKSLICSKLFMMKMPSSALGETWSKNKNHIHHPHNDGSRAWTGSIHTDIP